MPGNTKALPGFTPSLVCPRLKLAHQLANHFHAIAHHGIGARTEDGRLSIFVDRHHRLGTAHARQVLDCPPKTPMLTSSLGATETPVCPT